MIRFDHEFRNGRKALSFFVPIEFKFFLSHKIISWLNVVNESIDCEFNFESVTADDCTLQGQSYFELNVYTHITKKILKYFMIN